MVAGLFAALWLESRQNIPIMGLNFLEPLVRLRGGVCIRGPRSRNRQDTAGRSPVDAKSGYSPAFLLEGGYKRQLSSLQFGYPTASFYILSPSFKRHLNIYTFDYTRSTLPNHSK